MFRECLRSWVTAGILFLQWVFLKFCTEIPDLWNCMFLNACDRIQFEGFYQLKLSLLNFLLTCQCAAFRTLARSSAKFSTLVPSVVITSWLLLLLELAHPQVKPYISHTSFCFCTCQSQVFLLWTRHWKLQMLHCYLAKNPNGPNIPPLLSGTSNGCWFFRFQPMDQSRLRLPNVHRTREENGDFLIHVHRFPLHGV